MLAGGQVQDHGQPAVAVRPRPPGTRPAEPQAAAAAGPDAALTRQVVRWLPAEARSQVERDPQPGRPVDGLDPAQQHASVRVGRQGQCLAAFGDAARDPAAAPDQASGLVIAAPDVARVRWRHRVAAAPAKQRGEDRRAVPVRHAEPDDRTVRIDQRAPLAVGNEGVLAQHVRLPASVHQPQVSAGAGPKRPKCEVGDQPLVRAVSGPRLRLAGRSSRAWLARREGRQLHLT